MFEEAVGFLSMFLYFNRPDIIVFIDIPNRAKNS